MQNVPQGAHFQTEVFEKVERPYMLGLRASSQDMRRKFFQIYNKSIPAPLFDRLQFLICTQSWEKLAGSFWLKEALVRPKVFKYTGHERGQDASIKYHKP